MPLTEQEKLLLQALKKDDEGVLIAGARPNQLIKGLAEKGAIVNVLTTTLSSRNMSGGTSVWRITEIGLSMIDNAGSGCSTICRKTE